jgi:2-dehydropantoate 2-reductase
LEVNDVDTPEVSEPLPADGPAPSAGGGRPWRVAILGPGGIGGLLAALSARDGDKVTCIAPPSTAAHLREHGVQVRSSRFGDFRVPVDVTTCLEAPVDVCYVAVKATSLEEALEGVPPAALGDGLVVPFLNGIDHVALLRRRYPADQVVAATIRIESARVAPGVVEHPTGFAAVELASGPAERSRVEELAARLERAGFDVRVRDDELRMLWAKLSVLAPIALLGTHEGAPFGVVRERRRDDLVAVVHEIAAAARAGDGVELDPRATLGTLEQVPGVMRSSMQRDAEAGKPLELDAIGGTILRAAARGGVEAPVAERLVSEIAARVVSS